MGFEWPDPALYYQCTFNGKNYQKWAKIDQNLCPKPNQKWVDQTHPWPEKKWHDLDLFIKKSSK